LDFENFAVSIEKSHFFQKKAKNQNFEIPWRPKKSNLLQSSEIHWENQCSKNQPNHNWSLGGFLKKPLLSVRIWDIGKFWQILILKVLRF
jgi:hypothetical protein